jgi:protein SCO1/2
MKISNLSVLILLVLTSCSKKEDTLPFYNSPTFNPIWDVSNVNNFHKIRDFSLIDQDGQTFTERNIEGKICVVDFFFTSCPGICPKMTNSLSTVSKAFKKDTDFLILSHSVTPDKDNPAVLKKYAERKKINTKSWKLLTGKKSEIYDLGRNYYFVDENLGEKKSEDDFLHTENFVLLDKNQRIRGIYNGLDVDAVNQLIEDIKILQKE